MLFSIEALAALLLAIPTIEGSVIAERQAAAPINLRFSVPGSVFSALTNSNTLSNYLQPNAQSTKSNRGPSNNNVDPKQLTQGFFIIDQFLQQGPAAAARLGATFLSDPGKPKFSSTNTTDNNPDNNAIFSTVSVEGSPGTNGADNPGLGVGAGASGSAAG
jgi:hypothetical protein